MSSSPSETQELLSNEAAVLADQHSLGSPPVTEKENRIHVIMYCKFTPNVDVSKSHCKRTTDINCSTYTKGSKCVDFFSRSQVCPKWSVIELRSSS